MKYYCFYICFWKLLLYQMTIFFVSVFSVVKYVCLLNDWVFSQGHINEAIKALAEWHHV